jgi:hypothetical protein
MACTQANILQVATIEHSLLIVFANPVRKRYQRGHGKHK